jgi:hypothetical protein
LSCARSQEDIDTFDKYSGPTAGYIEQCYFYELTGKRGGKRNTAVLLKNADGGLGSSMHYSLKQMPCFTIWKNTAAIQDGYVNRP